MRESRDDTGPVETVRSIRRHSGRVRSAGRVAIGVILKSPDSRTNDFVFPDRDRDSFVGVPDARKIPRRTSTTPK